MRRILFRRELVFETCLQSANCNGLDPGIFPPRRNGITRLPPLYGLFRFAAPEMTRFSSCARIPVRKSSRPDTLCEVMRWTHSSSLTWVLPEQLARECSHKHRAELIFTGHIVSHFETGNNRDHPPSALRRDANWGSGGKVVKQRGKVSELNLAPSKKRALRKWPRCGGWHKCAYRIERQYHETSWPQKYLYKSNIYFAFRRRGIGCY